MSALVCPSGRADAHVNVFKVIFYLITIFFKKILNKNEDFENFLSFIKCERIMKEKVCA